MLFSAVGFYLYKKILKNYHFEDIPDLFRWMIREYTNSIFKEALSKGNTEDGLRSFFVMAINALPYAKRGMESNYGEEFERISRQNIQYFFAAIAEKQNLYGQCSGNQAGTRDDHQIRNERRV